MKKSYVAHPASHMVDKLALSISGIDHDYRLDSSAGEGRSMLKTERYKTLWTMVANRVKMTASSPDLTAKQMEA